MLYAYEAMNADGHVIHDVLDAGDRSEALETLRTRGLMIMRLTESQTSRAARKGVLSRGRLASRDLLLFTRQMKMLLESGADLVTALEAIEEQSSKAAMRDVTRTLRKQVEGGGTLADGFAQHPKLFKPMFCTMVEAGEVTGTLPATFARLNMMIHRQEQVRKTLLGAALYPLLLSVLCVGVVGVLVGFVVPRFGQLFENLRAKLPPTTALMLHISTVVRSTWPIMLGGMVAFVAATVAILRHDALRAHLDRLLLRTPLVGRLAQRLIFARIARIWSSMLQSHVPLLETINQSRGAVRNTVFRDLVTRIHEAVSGGGRIGRVLGESGLVEPVVASAIATGEENGRLTEAVVFVSDWLDEDNQQLIGSVMKVAEPGMLALLGLVVGTVAMGLFLPLFDIAMAGG